MKYALVLLALLAFPAQADEYAPTTNHVLAFTGTSAATTTGFGTDTLRARFVCSAACFVALEISGVTPVATSTGATSYYLPANVPETFVVSPGMKAAAIQASSAGVLYITELSK